MSSARPNFLFVMADQMTAPAMPFAGNRTAKAPHMNRLAEEGVVFENCYCNLPMCGPSRASMHAGRLPFSIEMYDNASEFHSAIPTFAHYLRQLDYRVEMSGKMHFVGAGPAARLRKAPYDRDLSGQLRLDRRLVEGARDYRPTNLTMAPIIEIGALHPHDADGLRRRGRLPRHPGALRPGEKGRRMTARFMLTVSFTQPHSPYRHRAGVLGPL